MQINIGKLKTQDKQIIMLYAATLFGIFLGVLSSVINTRNLNPSDYGNVKYVLNILSFISGLLLFGFFVSGSRLLALSKSEINSRSVRGVLVLMLAGISVVISVLMIFSYLVHKYWLDPSVSYLFIVAIPISSQMILLNYINTTSQGDNHLGRISIARLVPSGLYVLIAYWVYKQWEATPGLMILLQSGIAVITYVIIIITTKPSFKYLKSAWHRLAKENENYGIHLYYGSLAMVATQYISGITLGLFNTDNSEVAYYTLSLTIATPLSFLPSIIGTAYFKKFATQDYIERKVLVHTVILTFLSCVLFLIVINPLVKFLYSEEYSQVGLFASFLAIGTCIHGFGDMLNRFLGAHGQGIQIRNVSYACGLVLVVGSVLFVYWYGIMGAIATRILSDVVYTGLMVYYYNKFVD